MNYEPLLYAVVGFAAFHSTLKKHNGKIQDFLGYYNKSVSLLRKSLSSGQRHTDATMMTILQLAAFEVRFGTSLFLKISDLQRLGVSWRLGKPPWPSKGRIRNALGTVHSAEHHGNRSSQKDPCMVCTV